MQTLMKTRPLLILSLGVILVLLIVLGAMTGWEVRKQMLNQDLIAAIKRQDTPAALRLLAEGADGDARDLPPDHRTLLQRVIDLLHGKQPESDPHAPNTLLLALTPTEKENDNGLPVQQDARLTRALLQHGAIVNVVDADGDTPLILACQNGFLETARLLLERGAKVNAVGDSGETSLTLACWGDHLETARLLLARGARTNLHGKESYTALSDAIQCHDPQLARLLLDHGADFDKHDDLEFLLACVNTPDLFQFLIKKGANPKGHVSRGKYGGSSVFYCTIVFNNQAGAKMLLARGIDPNKGEDDGAPLMFTARRDEIDNLMFLLRHGARVNAVDEEGWSALTYACDNGLTDCMKILLDHGAKVNQKDKYGETLLMHAIDFAEDEPIRLLLKYGADVNARNKKGETALMLAAGDCNDSVVELLLKYGAHVNLRDHDGKTALTHAEHPTDENDTRDPTLIETLREHGAIH